MKRSLFRVVCLVGVVAALLLSNGVALAGFDWYGECPPRSGEGKSHIGVAGVDATIGVTPPANEKAYATSDGTQSIELPGAANEKNKNVNGTVTGTNPNK